MKPTFNVALTADFYDSKGVAKYRDIGLSVLTEHPPIQQTVFKEHRKQIGADQIGDAHGVIVLTPSVTAESVSKSENLLVIARFGVGYDAVDVGACTAADVLVTITTGAVDRPVAEATIGWMIALSHNVWMKDKLVRTGQWEERSKYMGRELRDRTLGVIGLGGIARQTIEMLRGFGMKQPLAFDPFASEEMAAKTGALLVSLEELLKQADFVSIHCPLTEVTRGLIGARELAMMKPDAYLLNTARGGIVDEDALYDALKSYRIAGAALDCFAQEPVTTPSRFTDLDNVLLAPHSIAWTDELFRDIGRAACRVMVDLSLRKKPNGALNPELFERPSFKAKWERLLMTLFLWIGLTLVAVAQGAALKSEANVMVELTLTATGVHPDPFNEVKLDVIFNEPQGGELRVPAFWAGTNVWKARYASPMLGTHRFRSECSDTKDQGLHGVAGTVEVKPYTGQNPLYVHGPLKLSANRRYMEYHDGTPFFWMGDTWWMGLSARLHWTEDVQKLTQDRKEKGFNVIQLVAGLFPDMHPFDPRGANEAGYPWQADYASIRPEYFDAADKRLLYLVDQGFTPVIVGAWGYFMQWMGVEKSEAHWRYLIARYGALPVVWCTAGEANLSWYLAKDFPQDDRKQVKDWTEVTRYLRATDPFHRLITIHPTGLGRLSARHAMDDLSLIDIDMLQTPHGQRDAVAPTVNTMRESYADKPLMPVINGEAAFEMLSDTLPTQWTRRMFWLCMMNGAAGHTYGANGIWQVNRQGDPHGPSPHHNGGVGYGKISWDEAMNLPGSRQVGLGGRLLQQYPWHKFEPHPEWAAFAGKANLSFDGANWIWFPEGNPAQNAPAEKRLFRKAFSLPEGKGIKSAQLRASADDKFDVRLNGEALGGAENWKAGKQFNGLARFLKAGANVLAIEAENLPAPSANPAGLIARMEIEFADGESLRIISDATWRSAKGEVPGWDKTGFDDHSWDSALAIGNYGEGPWGKIDPVDNDGVFGPQSAGIPGVVRIIYVPESEPIVVKNLGRQAVYAATFFDPVTGAKTALPSARADDAGLWTCPPPDGIDHDWVLILESKTEKAAR